MATVRLAFTLTVVAVATSIVLVSSHLAEHVGDLSADSASPLNEPASVLAIYNAFPSSTLFVECSTDMHDSKKSTVPPLSTYGDSFYPDATAFMLCTIYKTEPTLWGSFELFVRNPLFRACYEICDWRADADGLTLVSEGGLKQRVFLPWQRKN